jgi:hypothetical protein
MCGQDYAEQLARIEKKLDETLAFQELLKSIALPLLASKGNKVINAYLRAKGLSV